ncbi:putative actinidain [Helianthus annuus]|nr:putative actinidain [Helianthus annuus]
MKLCMCEILCLGFCILFLKIKLLFREVTIMANKDWKIFRKWKVEHGKSYPTADEEKRRFETFQQHLREIEAHNSGPDASYYTKGLNPFSDMTFEQFKLGFLMHESVDDGLYDSETDEEDVIHQSKYYYPFKPNDH